MLIKAMQRWEVTRSSRLASDRCTRSLRACIWLKIYFVRKVPPYLTQRIRLITCSFGKMIQRFQRHFPPPTSQFRFSPERVVDPPVFAHKIIFTSEGPLTTPPFSPAGTASGLNAHRGVNISGPQGTSSALQKPRGEWNRPSKGYSLAKYCSVTLEWGMGKFTDVEVSRNNCYAWAVPTCAQSISCTL